MIRRNYALTLLLSLGFLSTCCAEENLATFFDELEVKVKDLETKNTPPKKEIAPDQLVNTEAPEKTEAPAEKIADHPAAKETTETKPQEAVVTPEPQTTSTQEETPKPEATTVTPSSEPVTSTLLEDDEDEISIENELELELNEIE